MKKNLWTWLLHDKKKEKNAICMKICLCLAFILGGGMLSNTFAQTERLTLKRENASMLDIIFAVEKQSKMTFVYSMDAVNKIGKITIDVKDVLIDSVMNICLGKTDYTYSLEKNVVVIKKRPAEEKQATAAAQVKRKLITGTVYDKAKEVLAGVSVYIKGTTVGVVTDVDGNYKIEVPENTTKLVFSFVGMETKEIEIGKETKVNVVLSDAVSGLDEVTVVAYGERKTRELIGAVSSVKAKDLEEVPAASLETLLQGHMAGVEVNNISGSPGGGGSRVNIRGYNSLLTGEDMDGSPLYVIDGVPVHSFTSAVTGTNMLAEIDPSTIESVEVLKDAASAALYGSRASNGVILITTKQGKMGRGKFSANVSYSYSILPETPVQTGGHLERMANIYAARNQRAAAVDWSSGGIYTMPQSPRESYMTNGAYDYFWNNGQINPYREIPRVLLDSLNPFYNNSTNWWKHCFRAGKILNANLQTSGGTEHIKYMVGAGWYDEKGIMLGSDFSRVNILTNLNVTPRENLNVDARLYLAYTDRSRGAANTSFTKASKIEGLTVDPKTALSLLPGAGATLDETLKQINETMEKNISYRIRASLGLRYEFIKGLTLSSMVAMDFSEGKRNSFIPSYLDGANHLSVSTGAVSSSTLFNNENLLNYNISFKERHNFDVLLGMSYLREAKDAVMGSGKGGPSDQLHYVQEGFPLLKEISGTITAMQEYKSNFEEKVMLSYFGRLVYNFDKKYLFEYTLRRDGSSVFGEDVRWAMFPSVAVGWAFSEEKFMKRAWWLNFGKIRASWGTSGQQFGDPYLAHGTLEIGSDFLGNVGMLPSQILNRNLTWEESDQYDIGLDMEMFDYRLKVKLDYYYKYSKSLLYNVDLPGNVYFHQKAWQNAMEISNQGIELELNYDILRDTDFKWRGKFNISRNWNRFEKSYTKMDMSNLVIGRPIHGLFLYKDLGYIQSEKDIPAYYDQQGNKNNLNSLYGSYPYSTGSRLIQDMNMDGRINSDDLYYAGSTLPQAYGGWANELRWKGFDLNVLFTYSLGRKIVNLYKITSLQFTQHWQPIFLDYANTTFWEQPGDDPDYPVQTVSDKSYAGQYDGQVRSNMENVHYMRCKQLTIGYNFPKEWMNKVNIEGIRVFFTAENLFLLSNYSGVDPEVVDPFTGYDNFRNYPLARKLTLGLTLKF